jgi:hypothetical protein
VLKPERDPYSIPVITRRICERVVGNDTLVDKAVEAGVLQFHRTPTGRQNTSPKGFAALLDYVHGRESV